MNLKDKIQIRIWKLLPPNFPTDLADAFDMLKRGFWKAAAPAALAKEKGIQVYLERVIAEQNDRIEELEAVDPNTRIGVLEENNLTFRMRIARMQDRIVELEEENRALKARLSAGESTD